MRLCSFCREELQPHGRCEADGHSDHHAWCCTIPPPPKPPKKEPKHRKDKKK
jgi:hypothetical protein